MYLVPCVKEIVHFYALYIDDYNKDLFDLNLRPVFNLTDKGS